MGVPLTHQFSEGFSLINHPLGCPHFRKPPYLPLVSTSFHFALDFRRYPSDELPGKELLCSKLLDAEEAKDQLWAVHVPVSQGAARKMLSCFCLTQGPARTQVMSDVSWLRRKVQWKEHDT